MESPVNPEKITVLHEYYNKCPAECSGKAIVS
jgi:hypothetical protein